MQTDLELALMLAREAEAVTMSRYRALDLKVETKPDRTPVTEADKAVLAYADQVKMTNQHGHVDATLLAPDGRTVFAAEVAAKELPNRKY